MLTNRYYTYFIVIVIVIIYVPLKFHDALGRNGTRLNWSKGYIDICLNLYSKSLFQRSGTVCRCKSASTGKKLRADTRVVRKPIIQVD